MFGYSHGQCHFQKLPTSAWRKGGTKIGFTNKYPIHSPSFKAELLLGKSHWICIKGTVARLNRTFKLADVRNIHLQAIDIVNAQKWIKCIDHMEKVESNMWQIDSSISNSVIQGIVNLNETLNLYILISIWFTLLNTIKKVINFY